MTRILAIEPSPERGELLRRLVCDAVDAEVVPVTSAKAALAAIEAHQPDVILTSSILPPQDDRELVSHLRETPALRHLPILTVPPVMEPPHVDTTLLARLRRRRQPSFWLAYDFDAVVSRIEDAIEDSRWAAAHAPEGPALETELADFAPQPTTDAGGHSRRPMRLRKRARRWEGWKLSWLSTVRLPSGFDLHLINISSTGLLVESQARIPMGTTTNFDLWGPYRKMSVPGRIVRSDVGVVDSSGVRYHAAAVFEHPIDTMMPAEQAIDATTHLEDLVTRVLDRAELGAPPRELRAEFEAGVMALVPVRDIRLRVTPTAELGHESIYFTVPGVDTPAVLQVTFDRGYQPQLEELDTLKLAATAAARMLGVTEPLHLFLPESASSLESHPTE
jgi:CheY-like chemotaxis protein